MFTIVIWVEILRHENMNLMTLNQITDVGRRLVGNEINMCETPVFLLKCVLPFLLSNASKSPA